jgi:hypothetical protein
LAPVFFVPTYHLEPKTYTKLEETYSDIPGVEVGPNTSDEALVAIINADVGEFSKKIDELRKIKDTNFNYYKGKQRNGESVITNRVFVSVETKTAIITSETPDPWVIAFPKTASAKRMTDKVTRKLRDLWEYDVNMQQIMETNLRSYFMARVGFLKWGFNEELGVPFTKSIPIESIVFDVDAPDIHSTPIIHYVKEPITKVLATFPEAKTALLARLSSSNVNTRSKLTYQECYYDFYEGDKRHVLVVYKYMDVILGREVDPYFNSKGKNHFKFPKKPFIPMNSLKVGDALVDDTSEIEQVMELQDLITKRKRQIDRNAMLANGILVGLSDAISTEDWAKINENTFKVLLDQAESIGNSFGVVTGQPFSNGVFNDQEDSKAEFDNVMGTHDTTRGEKTRSETLGGQVHRQQADLGRIDLTTRNHEQVAEDWYNAMVQLMYVYDFDEIPILREETSEMPEQNYARQQGLVPADDRNDVISKDEIKEYKFRVIVKKGSTVPMNPATMQDASVMLWQTGMIDPITAAEMYFGDMTKDPRAIAKRMYLWTKDPARLFPELQGKDNIIDQEAITHIVQMINAQDEQELMEAQQLVFSGVANPQAFTPEELDKLSKHITTHQLYTQGVEISQDLPEFEKLTDAQKEAIKAHIVIETGILNINNNGGMGSQPEMPLTEEELAAAEAGGGELPPEEMAPAPLATGEVPTTGGI